MADCFSRICAFVEEVCDLLVTNSDVISAQKYDSKTQYMIDCVKNRISVKLDKIHVKLWRVRSELCEEI